MRYYSLLFPAVIAAFLFSSELRAQNDKTAVMHAAALFIKDSLPGGPILLELDGVPSNSAQGDATARSLNATRGRAKDAITCTSVQPNRKESCSIAGQKVLVEILYPYVLGNKAQATVKYTYEHGPGRVGYSAWELQLVRDPASGWQVSKVLAKGRS
jgi:hypothetical protein